MTDQSAQSIVFEQLARIGKAVASANRIQILDVLASGERSVDDLAQETGLSVKNTSAQLRVLRQAHLVESRKSGLFHLYRLADPTINAFVLSLRDLAEARLAEMREITEQVHGERKSLAPLDGKRLLAQARSGEVVVLDVREPSAYAAGHIPGARSVPIEELEKALGTIPRDVEVVAYCRGPFCVLAADAVKLLRKRGYQATHLHDGIVEWTAAGLPLETGNHHETK